MWRTSERRSERVAYIFKYGWGSTKNQFEDYLSRNQYVEWRERASICLKEDDASLHTIRLPTVASNVNQCDNTDCSANTNDNDDDGSASSSSTKQHHHSSHCPPIFIITTIIPCTCIQPFHHHHTTLDPSSRYPM